jgi:acyl-coenzyme A thioesterase PaaI-like protein
MIGVELSAALPADRGAAYRPRSVLRNRESAAQTMSAGAALSAANAALVALIQKRSSAAMAISIVNLMPGFLRKLSGYRHFSFVYITNIGTLRFACTGPVLA